MSRAKVWMALALAGVVCLCWSGKAVAQDKPARDNEGDRRSSRTRMTPEEMRQRMEQWRKRASDMLRERLGASEEEWKILQPRMEKVQTLQRQARSGMRGMMGFGSFGGRSRGSRGSRGPRDSSARPAPTTPTATPATPTRERSEIEKKTAALSEVLKKEAPTTSEITTALTELRAARAKSQKELTQARKELQEIVTPKQEAILVLMGTLE